MMKKYKHIIFDADHTLIDFDADERRAFRAAFPAGTKEDVIEDMWRYSYENWAALGLNNVHEERIQNTFHTLYHKHVKSLFDYAEAHYPLPDRAAAEKAFGASLSTQAHVIDGAMQTVKALAQVYTVSIATNGLVAMQTQRLKAFMPYLKHVFISEELGVIKPRKEFYDCMLNALHAGAEECLMIGDSLSSDIAGANGAGMDCIWFNRFSRPLSEGVNVLTQVKELTALLPILL